MWKRSGYILCFCLYSALHLLAQEPLPPGAPPPMAPGAPTSTLNPGRQEPSSQGKDPKAPGKTAAQTPYQLTIENTDKLPFFKRLNYGTRPANDPELQSELNKMLSYFWEQGYLAAGYDSVVQQNKTVHAYLQAGPRYQWARMKVSPADMPVAGKLGYGEKLYTNQAFRYREMARTFEKIIRYYENNGYPFVSVRLDSIIVEDNVLNAKLVIDKGSFIKLDSIHVEGTAKVNKRFLYRYLELKPGMPYNEQAFRNVSKKLRQLPFLAEYRPQILRLTDKQNKLNLFLNKKNASQFDGIIGILPDNQGKTVLTGDVKIKLVNGIFRSGETFELNWRRLQTQTQDFKANFIYPYLFGWPIGVDYTIKIYRKDSTFLDVNNDIGLQYYFSGFNTVKVFYKQRTTNLLSTAGLSTITVLPDYADISTQSYGLATSLEKLDYRFNPRKGYSIVLSAQLGNRRIKENPNVNDIVYQGLTLNTTQYQSEGVLAGYYNLAGKSVIKFGLRYGTIFGSSTIFKNELFRIGGLKTLRGFDEESIYVSSYTIGTLEYRFLFSQNSNIFLFSDGAWYENNSVNTYVTDTPYSFGAGINFETKAGIFTLSYGLGKQFNNPIDIRAGKIHFGLTAIF